MYRLLPLFSFHPMELGPAQGDGHWGRRKRRSMWVVPLVVLSATAPGVAAQDAHVSGIVRTPDRAPVAGALVELEPVGQSATADGEGRFTITVPEGEADGREAVLRVSSLGYRAVEHAFSLTPGSHEREFVLREAAVALDEVLVTGTVGRRERRVQPALVGGVEAEGLVERAPVTSLANLLQGRLPGVTVQQRSGTTGTAQTIRIRGRTSVLLSDEPLVFLDGVRMDDRAREFFFVGGQLGSRLNDLRIQDVERLEVVKGPAAATLYGADASAGVVQIFTRRGEPGAGFRQEVTLEGGRVVPAFDPPDNWAVCEARHVEEDRPLCRGLEPGTPVRDNPLERSGVLRSGARSAVNWQLRGGGERFGAFTSLGVDREEGTLPSNEMERISGRANFDFLVSDELRVEAGFGLARSRVRLPHNDNNVLGYLGGGLLGDPLTLGFNAHDGWFAAGRGREAISRIETLDTTLRIQPRLSASHSPVPWFTQELTVGGDLTRSEARSFFPRNDRNWYPDRDRNSGEIIQVRENRDQLTLDYRASARWEPLPWLRVDPSAGLQLQTLRRDLTSATGIGLASNRVRAVDAAARTSGGQDFQEERQAGGMGELQLSLGERLFLQAGARGDRHSSFGGGGDLFFSPRVGASYVVSDEPHFRDRVPDRWVGDLRFRIAYGTTGRAPRAPVHATFSPEPFAVRPDRVEAGVVPRSPGSPGLRPERGTEVEAGVDGSFLQDRLALEVTYFQARTRGLILEEPLPPSLGFPEQPLANVGRVSNWGWELGGRLRLHPGPGFTWEVGFGYNTLTNRVLDMGAVAPFGERNWVIPGAPVQGYHGYRILEVDEEAGRAVVSDDMEFIGNPPDLPGREAFLSTSLSVPGDLMLELLADYRGDVHLFNGTDEWRERVVGVGERAVRKDELPGRERIERFGPYVTQSGVPIPADIVWTPYVEPADFLRLREVSLTYRFSPGLLALVPGAERISATFTARNLATWTRRDFAGFDPESSYSATMDFLTMPPERRFVLRLTVGF